MDRQGCDVDLRFPSLFCVNFGVGKLGKRSSLCSEVFSFSSRITFNPFWKEGFAACKHFNRFTFFFYLEHLFSPVPCSQRKVCEDGKGEEARVQPLRAREEGRGCVDAAAADGSRFNIQHARKIKFPAAGSKRGAQAEPEPLPQMKATKVTAVTVHLGLFCAAECVVKFLLASQ